MVLLAAHAAEGVAGREIPLNADAVAAFKVFDELNAYGTTGASSANRSFQKACAKEGLGDDIVLYDIRHSFLTETYALQKDEATVKRLGLHSENSTVTKRYTMAAHREVDAAAADNFSEAQRQRRVQENSDKLPNSVPKTSKLRRIK